MIQQKKKSDVYAYLEYLRVMMNLKINLSICSGITNGTNWAPFPLYELLNLKIKEANRHN